MVEISPKRSQQLQIHSEAHISTVSMMMDALRRQKSFPKVEEEPEEEKQEEFSQKAFWPQIVRVRRE